MPDLEDVVTDLLVALRLVDRTLSTRRGELIRDDAWSSVTTELEVSEWEIATGSPRLGFWGYVDGEKTNVGGIAWTFDVVRDGTGWTVERTLNLNANTKNYQEIVVELLTVECENTGELATRLPDLVRELLNVPSPDPSSD
jgi:hypothetical protein